MEKLVDYMKTMLFTFPLSRGRVGWGQEQKMRPTNRPTKNDVDKLYIDVITRQLRVAYNSVYRKLFGYSYRESVTSLQHALERPTWEELVLKRKADFDSRRLRCAPDSLARAFP